MKFALQTMFTELFHWMIDIPTGHPPDPSKFVTGAGVAIAAATIVVLGSVILPPVVSSVRHPRRLTGPLTAPALAIGCPSCSPSPPSVRSVAGAPTR